MIFEWDENKREANIAKHGIDFDDAELVSADPLFIVTDSRKDYDEIRMLGMGTLEGRVVVVRYTLRGSTIQLISLRKAKKREQAKFPKKKK